MNEGCILGVFHVKNMILPFQIKFIFLCLETSKIWFSLPKGLVSWCVCVHVCACSCIRMYEGI